MLHPIFHLQPSYPSKLLLIVGYKDTIQTFSMGSNEHIKRANRYSFLFKITTNDPILNGCFVIEVENLKWYEKLMEGCEVFFWNGTFPSAIFQFSQCDN